MSSPSIPDDLQSTLAAAVSDQKLLASSAENIKTTLSRSNDEVTHAAIRELIEGADWTELNDRFYRTLAFGTGGLRGRTIGKVLTAAEKGTPTENGRPEFPCIGTNAMNYLNVSRATQGLARYVKNWIANQNPTARAAIVFAHDTRHFSKEFAALAAKISADLGCDAYLFDGPRSTPQLSFAVRHVGATAGVVVTASHNPPHDNGYKVYFSDGAQVVDPHATGIIDLVNSTETSEYEPLMEADRGNVYTLGAELDNAYMEQLEGTLLQPELVRTLADFKVVFSPIHGTGGIISVPMLRKLGFTCETVAEQDEMNGWFPTVKSPNPENAEALKMATELADKINADLVIATDPDADRMGVVVRAADGSMKLLTGNQIGSLMAYYRARAHLESGLVTAEQASRATIIKTYVTTDLQKAIAKKAGMHCVETLTGFKYIGAKLGKYEAALPDMIRDRYNTLSVAQKREALLEHSHFYVFGGEESYGYSGADFVRDKDANMSVVMFAETAAYAKSRGMTLDQLLDEIYASHGYYQEKNGALVFEGAEGADKIQRLAADYAANPPVEVDGRKVASFLNFAVDEIYDSEGDRVPAEKMLIVTLEDGGRFAVRPSGTEPKIKYYLFARVDPPEEGAFSLAQLADIKSEVHDSLESLWTWLQADADQRLAG